MAVVNSYNQENDQNNNQQAPGSLGGPVTLSQNAGSSNAGAAQVQQKGSGRFTNLKSIMDANKGAGQRIAGRIESSADKAVRSQQDEANKQVSGIRDAIGQEQNRLAQASNIAQTIRQGSTQDLQNLAQNQANDVAALRQGQTNLNQLQQQQQQAVGSLQNVAQNLSGIADSAKTEQGRFGLLKNALGGPSYTGGQRRLDQLLLQGTGAGALGQLQQNLQSRAQQQQQQLKQVQGELDPALSTIGEQAALRQKEIQEALGSYTDQTGALGDLNKQLEQSRLSAIEKQEQDLKLAQDRISKNQLTEQEAKLLGLAPNQRIFDINVADYAPLIQRGDTDITQADIANQEQMNRLSALQQLAGLDPASINLGNKFGTIGPSFSKQDELKQRVDEKQKIYENIVDRVTKNIPELANYSRNLLKGSAAEKYMSLPEGQTAPSTMRSYAMHKALRDMEKSGYSDASFKNLIDVLQNNATAKNIYSKSPTLRSLVDSNLMNQFNSLQPQNFLIKPTQMGQVE